MRRLTGQGYGPLPTPTAKLFDVEQVMSRVTGRTATVESASGDMTDPWRQQRNVVTDAAEQTTAEYLQANGWYNVKEFGAKGDGVTDDTAAIQAAINAASDAGGGVVFFPVGVYLALSLEGKSNVSLEGEPGSILRKNGGSAGTHIIDFVSTASGSPVSGTATDAIGDVTLDFPGTGNFVEGDYALLYDSTFAYSSFGRNQELVRVTSVAAATVTVKDAINRTYLLANSPKLQKLDMVRNVTIKGLRFELPAGTDGGNVYFDLASEIWIRNCQFAGFDDDAGVLVNQSAWMWIDRNLFEDAGSTASGFGYAISIIESSHNILVSHNIARNIREMNASNGAMLIGFVGNLIHTAEASGINTHGTGCKHVLIANNVVSNVGNAGIAVGHSTCEDHDEDVIIVGNKVSNCQSEGIMVNCDADVNLNIAVIGNFVYNVATQLAAKNGILVRHSRFVTVQGNKVVPVDSNVNAGICLVDAEDSVVTSNYIESVPSGDGIQYQGTCPRLRMAFNTLHDVGGFDVNDATSGSTTNAVCEYNYADGTNVSIGTGTRRVGNSFDVPPGVSANRGDNNVTLAIGTDAATQRFATTLTANRTVTLPASGNYDGAKFRIVRTGLGAFTLNVGGLKTIPSATAAFVDVEYDGSGAAWRLTGYGTL